MVDDVLDDGLLGLVVDEQGDPSSWDGLTCQSELPKQDLTGGSAGTSSG
jgi:hypothetical protein